MDEFHQINEKIDEYTGGVKKFKTGLVWEKDPSAGDQVKITAIATGFKVNDLSKIAKTDLGNLIMIDRDFKYVRPAGAPAFEKAMPDLNDNVKIIGFNSGDNVKRFHFEADEKPVLILSPGQNKGELENIPAIKRKVKTEKENR